MIITPMSNRLNDPETEALWMGWAELPTATRRDAQLWVRVEELPESPGAYAVIFGMSGNSDALESGLTAEAVAHPQCIGSSWVKGDTVKSLLTVAGTLRKR